MKLDTLWEFIDAARGGSKEYIPERELYDRLKELYNSYDEKQKEVIEEEWKELGQYLEDTEIIDQMHWSRGGVVTGSDDALYMDHKNWVIAQGQELVESFIGNGRQVLLDYIAEYGLTENNYTYESMVYIFYED